jgi:hypothetical protein
MAAIKFNCIGSDFSRLKWFGLMLMFYSTMFVFLYQVPRKFAGL